MHPGTLELIDATVHYRINGSTSWKIPVSAIRVLGEATNDHGPFQDDYFVCFATDSGAWHVASIYANGREEFLKLLSKALGCELRLELAGSTDFNSNVLWPPHLAGMKMFEYKPKHSKTLISRLLGTGSNMQSFSDAVLDELQ